MSLAFLHPAAAVRARSPLARCTAQEGARFAVRDGWEVAVAYAAGAEAERRSAERCAGWADTSQLIKLELQGAPGAVAAVTGVATELGTATRQAGAWWCPLSPERMLVLAGGPGTELRERLEGEAAAAAGHVSVVDVTTTFAALTLVGPLATEVLARFSALDLRPPVAPVGALRPGSVARQPAVLIREAEHRYLILSGAATGEYLWSVVADAGHHLGGRPIGADALAAWEIADA